MSNSHAIKLALSFSTAFGIFAFEPRATAATITVGLRPNLILQVFKVQFSLRFLDLITVAPGVYLEGSEFYRNTGRNVGSDFALY